MPITKEMRVVVKPRVRLAGSHSPPKPGERGEGGVALYSGRARGTRMRDVKEVSAPGAGSRREGL